MLISYKVGIDSLRKTPPVGKPVSFSSWNYHIISGFTNRTLLINPGIIKGSPSCAFIQVIVGNSREIFYFQFPTKDFSYNKRSQEIKIKNNRFSPHTISFDLFDITNRISGDLHFRTFPLRTNKFRSLRSLFFPSPFSHLQQYHPCKTKGNIAINEEAYVFTDSQTLIQRQWGTICPAAWLNISGCDFYSSILSFSISFSKYSETTPNITGHIKTTDEEYYFNSISESSIELFQTSEDILVFQIQTPNYTLRVMVEYFQKLDYFLASGTPNRQGKLTTEALIFVTFSRKGKKVLKDYSKNGLVEQTGNLSLLYPEKG